MLLLYALLREVLSDVVVAMVKSLKTRELVVMFRGLDLLAVRSSNYKESW